MNAIETKDLSVKLGRQRILADLNFAVPSSTVAALLGPNGAGKTTLLRTLINVYQPEAGSALVLGKESYRLQPSDFESIGYVSESQEVPLWMRSDRFLKMCSELYPQWDEKWCAELVKTLDIPLEKPLKELSRGMLEKIKLISSLAFRPKLLLLDEPFSGLDPIVRDETIALVVELCQRSECTVFISSHDLQEVERIADSIVFLKDGRIRDHSSLDSLLRRFRTVSLLLQTENSEWPSSLPPTWRVFDRSERTATIVHTDFSPERLKEELSQLQAPIEVAECFEMSLKEIYRAVMEAR